MNSDVQLIQLFHGTSSSRASLILKEGLIPIDDFDQELASIAAEFSFEAVEIRSTLENMGQYAVIQSGRGRSVWYTPNRESGWNWASRSPELRYEALSAVWLLLNGMGDDPFRDPSGWINSPQCCAFVLQGFWDDDPAVVEVHVPLNFLSDRDRSLVGSDLWAEWPEVRIDDMLEPAHVVGFEVRSRQVSFRAAAGLLGVSIEHLEKMVECDEISRPTPPREYGEPWSWSLEDFFALTGIGPERLHNVKGRSGTQGADQLAHDSGVGHADDELGAVS